MKCVLHNNLDVDVVGKKAILSNRLRFALRLGFYYDVFSFFLKTKQKRECRLE